MKRRLPVLVIYYYQVGMFKRYHFFNGRYTKEGVANGKIRDSPRGRDPSQKSEPETRW